MPGGTRPVCKINPVEQQSTGQAGPEVNRDLEVLFLTVNQLVRCVGKVADFLDSVNNGSSGGGSFGGGGGNNGGGGGGFGSGDNTLSMKDGAQFKTPGHFYYDRISTGADITLTPGCFGVYYITPTAAIAVTLPTTLWWGQWIIVVNGATAVGKTIDVKDAGVTICSLLPGEYSDLILVRDANGAPAWPATVAALS